MHIKKLPYVLKKNPRFFCFASGLLFALPFLNKYLFVFSFAGLIIFFYLLTDGEFNINDGGFKRPMCFFMGFYLPLYYWFAVLYPFNGFGFTAAEGIAVVVLACIGISLIHSLEQSLFVFLIGKLKLPRTLLPLGLASGFILCEKFMSLGALGFSWGRLSVAQSGFLPMIQSVSLFGSYFITLITVASSAYIALAVKTGIRVFYKIGACIIAANIICGCVLMLIPIKKEEEIKVALIQGNIASGEKWEYGKKEYVTDKYVSLTKLAAQQGDLDLILLPESAFPYIFTSYGTIYNELYTIAEEYNVTVMCGVLTEDNGCRGNSVIAIYPDGSISERYDKRHLVPFGEYMPYAEFLNDLLPFLADMNLDEGNYVAGNDVSLIHLDRKDKGVEIGSLVCFDSIFETLSRDSAKAGAELLALVTNDSWYKDSAGVYQHLGHAVVRATETGKYIIRAANTGVSAVISPEGKIISQLAPMTEGVLYETAYSVKSKTLYTYIGDVPIWFSAIFVIYSILILIIKRRKKENDT